MKELGKCVLLLTLVAGLTYGIFVNPTFTFGIQKAQAANIGSIKTPTAQYYLPSGQSGRISVIEWTPNTGNQCITTIYGESISTSCYRK